MIVNTGLLEAGLRSEFFARYAAMEALWPRFCMTVASTLPVEIYRWLGAPPMMRQWIGDRQPQGLRTESYSVENEDYEATMEVKGNELDDDQTGQIMIRVNEMAEAAKTYPDYLRSLLLENGGNAGFNGYDGVTFFNDAHVSGDSGSQDNNLTSAAADGTTPSTLEMKAAINNGVAVLTSFKNDKGQPANLQRSGVVVEVPWNMEQVAKEAATAVMLNNATNVMLTSVEVVVNQWLTSLDRFYISITGGVIKPFIMQTRRPLQFKSVAENDAKAAFNRRYQYGVDSRFKVAYGAWFKCVRHVFT